MTSEIHAIAHCNLISPPPAIPQELIAAQEQLLRELDMYQEIAVAKGLEYDTLNVKMDHCQESIETLSDEIQRLQGE